MVIKKRIVFVLLLLYFVYCVDAYSGVSPGGYTVNFEPGAEYIFNFAFSGDVDSSYEVYAEGDMAKYVTLSVDELNGGGAVNVLLELPQNVDVPGPHVIYIGAKEVGVTNGISIVANIQGKIVINVPYPGKYATMNFNVNDASAGEDVKMNINLNNLGEEEVNFKGRIDMYDQRERFLETLDIGEYNIAVHESKSIEYIFDTKPYPSGIYKAKAVFEYESGILEEEEEFRLGELLIKIVDATKKINRNTINQFNVYIESEWNEPIEDVYAEVNVFGKGIKFTTPSVDVMGFKNATLTGFFDTTGIEDNSFNVNVRVFYEGKYAEKFVKLSFKNETNYMLILGIIAAVIFIIVIIVLIIITIKLKRIKNEIHTKKKK